MLWMDKSMARGRIYIDATLKEGLELDLSREDSAYLRRVLRLSDGDGIRE